MGKESEISKIPSTNISIDERDEPRVFKSKLEFIKHCQHKDKGRWEAEERRVSGFGEEIYRTG